MNSIILTPRVQVMGAGIYEVGDPEKCYAKLFVTDTGRAMPVSDRVITEDDLLTVYGWGHEDGRVSE